MELPVMAQQSKLKGLQVLVTADMLHKDWLAHVKRYVVEQENGVYTDKNQTCSFIIGTEVEDNRRVHQLIYLPDISSAETLREKMKAHGNLDCSLCGRPRIRLSAEAIAVHVESVGGFMGPAHAFTPYTGMFAHFESVEDCYGGMAKKIPFVELGLSADSDLADTIERNHQFSFLSSSDAHSPWPHRMGREFNTIQMKHPSYKELRKAVVKKELERITLNAGLDPREGKYHFTACNSCYNKYLVVDAEKLNWKCIHCTGQIKRGVKDRIDQLATIPSGKHPSFRPPYKHLLPLAEIIQESVGIKNVNAIKVQSLWEKYVKTFENEIAVLLHTPIPELKEVDAGVGEKIAAFRNGWVLYIPGGGGQYGKPIIAHSERDFEKKKLELQDTLQKEMTLHTQKKMGGF
jgi:uncharacterized protein (TIGR00375 family)